MPDSSTVATEQEREEASLFLEWKDRYRPQGGNNNNNYHAFARDWNNEAARRFTQWSCGDESVTQIRMKSAPFLTQCHDELRGTCGMQ